MDSIDSSGRNSPEALEEERQSKASIFVGGSTGFQVEIFRDLAQAHNNCIGDSELEHPMKLESSLMLTFRQLSKWP